MPARKIDFRCDIEEFLVIGVLAVRGNTLCILRNASAAMAEKNRCQAEEYFKSRQKIKIPAPDIIRGGIHIH